MAARSYLAVKEDGAEDYTYVYSATDDVTAFYSLTTTALKKLEAGDYDDKEELKTAITNDYTKFKVTFHFDEANADKEGYVESKSFIIDYGKPIPSASRIYASTHNTISTETYYTTFKGFYNANRTALIDASNITISSANLTLDFGGNTASVSGGAMDKYVTCVYGDMNLYEELAPSNLLDDFSTPASVRGAITHKAETDKTGSYVTHMMYNMYEDEDADWYNELTDANGVTEKGVIEIPSQFNTNRTTESYRMFYFKSSIRSERFFFNSNDGYSKYNPDSLEYYSDYNEIDYDYVNFRIMIKTDLPNKTSVNLNVGSVNGVYGYYETRASSQKVNVNEWVNVKISRYVMSSIYNKNRMAAVTSYGTSNYGIFYISGENKVSEGAKEGDFKLYIDYMAYERDMRISVNGEDGVTFDEVETPKDTALQVRKFIKHNPVTSIIGEEVELGTALTSGSIVYTVTDPDGENVTLSGDLLNKFTPTKLGNYTVKATCDDYLLLGGNYSGLSSSKQYGEMTFEVKNRQVTATLKDANDIPFEDLTSIKLGTSIKIADVAVGGLDSIESNNVTYEVKYLGTDPATDVTVDGGVFTVNKAGQYTVVVKYNYNGYEFVSQPTELTVIARQVTAKFYVGEEEIDINNSIKMNTNVSIKVFVDGVETNENVFYYVEHVDSNPENNYAFTVTDGVFTVGFTGTYNISVSYAEGQEEASESETYTLTAIANTVENARYLNTFSSSTSNVAAYVSTDKTATLEGASWVSAHAGRYGILSTVGQTYNTNYSAFYLRAAEYATYKNLESAGFAQTVFGMSTAPDTLGYSVGVNCDNWDYLSIPAFFVKPEGVQDDTLKVYYANNTTVLEVPYGEWVELKLDKAILLRLIANAGRLFYQYTTSANEANYRKPTFYVDNGAASTVYIDSMSFEKYTEYEHLGELYLEHNGVQVPENAEYNISVSNCPATLTIKAKLNSEDQNFLDVSTFKVHYYEASGESTARQVYDKNGQKIGYTANNSFYYVDKSAFNTPCSLKVDSTSGNNATVAFMFFYDDEATNKRYVGYLAIKVVVTA